MKWLLIFAGVLVCVILIVLLVGYLLPVKHSASVTLTVNGRPEQVWQRLIDFKAYPNWRKEVKAVEGISDTQWVEIDQHDHRLPFSMTIKERLRTLVTRIDAKGLPFGGSWVYVLEDQGNATTLTITENGEVYNPLFRFVSKFIVGHTATLKKYSTYLEQSFK
jgi:Polyketide cyclase / dehydrase and lipid transport